MNEPVQEHMGLHSVEGGKQVADVYSITLSVHTFHMQNCLCTCVYGVYGNTHMQPKFKILSGMINSEFRRVVATVGESEAVRQVLRRLLSDLSYAD